MENTEIQQELIKIKTEKEDLLKILEQKEQEIMAYQEQFKSQEAIFTQIFDLYNQLEAQKKIIEKQNGELQELNNAVLQKSEEINQQNEEILSQRDTLVDTMAILELKSKHIYQSINYAKRIQAALLPSLRIIGAYFRESFVLYKPRDIVSGDFYWFKRTKDASYIAAGDCTGHGVPGALISMIALVSLNQIINEPNIDQPHLILKRLRTVITLLLKQKQNDVRDGMDISICAYHSQKRMMEYAGAMNPLYYIQNGEFTEIKADKISIGGQYDDTKNYTLHSVSLTESPTTFYLCSDGYQDQFGGKESRKFMVKNMKKMFHDIHHLEMKQQHDILDDTIEKWMEVGREPQTDDILIIGIKI